MLLNWKIKHSPNWNWRRLEQEINIKKEEDEKEQNVGKVFPLFCSHTYIDLDVY